MRCWVIHIGFLSPKREMFSLMCFDLYSLLDNVKRGRKCYSQNMRFREEVFTWNIGGEFVLSQTM